MKGCKIKVSLWAGLLLIAITVVAEPSHVRIVRLSVQQGKVEIDRNAGQGFEKAIENMPIVEGTKLRTGDNGSAEVELEDGTVVRLASDSQVEFPQLALDAGNKLTTVALDKGTAYFDIRHKGHDVITLALPDRKIDLGRSAHFRASLGSDQVRLSVFSGDLKLDEKGQNVTVKKNETVALDLNDSHYQMAKGIDPLVSDSWDHDRMQYQEAYANDVAVPTGPLSPYYGWSDLNYYGGWYSVPGYGTLWQPYNMYAGWSPYGTGAWAWYPGPGWTWVSGYPWGWLPYRYGNWQFIPGWGWAWQPGLAWNNWYAAPRIINAPPGFVVLRPPAMVAGKQPAPTVFIREPSLAAGVPANGARRFFSMPRGTTVISQPGILNPTAPSPNRGFSPRHGFPSNVPPPTTPKRAPRSNPEPRGEAGHGPGFMAHIGSGFSHIGTGMSSFAHASNGFAAGHSR
jgi:hypothetical protein